MTEENTVLVNLNMRNTILVSMLILVIYRTLSIRPVHWMMLAWNLTVIMLVGTALVLLNEYVRGMELKLPDIPWKGIIKTIAGLVAGVFMISFGLGIILSISNALYFILPENMKLEIFLLGIVVSFGVVLGGGYIIKKALNKERKINE